MAWTIEADFGGGWIDITIHCSGLTKRQRLHNNLRPTINTCSFHIDDIVTANRFNDAAGDIDLRIKDAGADWFIGLVRPTFENIVKYIKAELRVEGYDKGILLKQKISSTFYYRSYKVCDTGNKGTSIVHQLFYKAGIIDAELDLTDILVTLPFYGVEISQNKEYFKEISDLLYEFGWVYNVKDDGIFYMYDLYPTALGGLTPFDDTDLYNSLKISKKELMYEAVRVKWYPTTILNDIKVYEETDIPWLKRNEYYPAEVTTQKFSILEMPAVSSFEEPPSSTIFQYIAGLEIPDTSKWELLGTFNAKLTYKLVRVYERTFTYIEGAKQADIRFQASLQSWVAHRIAWFKVVADAVIRKKDEEFRPISPAGYIAGGGQKIKDVTTRFIGDATNAQRLANGMRKYFDYADFEYRGNTLGNFALNEYLDFTEAVMGLTTKLRVVEIVEEAQYGRKQITCEGIDDVTIVAVDVTKVKLPRIPLVPIEDKIEDYGETLDTLVGLDGEVYKNDDPADPEFHLFELSEPDCQNNYGLEPTDKIVHFEPAEFEDERRFRYRNPHVKRFNGLNESIFAERKNLVKDSEDLTTGNWANVGSINALTNLHINKLRFTQVKATVGNGYVYQFITFTGNTKKSISFIAKKGDDTFARCLLYDDTGADAKLDILITWATQTVAILAGDGVLHFTEWLDDETVWVSAITLVVTAANNNRVFLYGMTNGKYTYYTAIQAENYIYPSPYISNYRWPNRTRPAVQPTYEVTMQEKFVFKIKIKPWFAFDTTINHRIFSWYIDVTHHFKLYYTAAGDEFFLVWEDGGVAKTMTTEDFDDGSAEHDINSEIIFIGIIDLSTGAPTGSRFFLFLDGVKLPEDITWTGNIDALGSTFPTLSIGHELGLYQADSFIEYFKLWDWDGVALGAIENEEDFNVAVGRLTERFNKTLEEFDSDYQPLSKRGAIGIFQATENLVDDPEDQTTANWTNVNSTDVLSAFYIDGKRFTKVIATAGAGYVSYTIPANTFSGDGVKAIQGIIKKGDDDVAYLILRDGGFNRGFILITFSTHTVIGNSGTLQDAHWISEDTVWVALISTACTAANVHEVRCYAVTNGKYSYFTAIQVEDITYPTPYTPTIRKANLLNYQYRMPPIFTIMFWVRPWFIYNTAASPRFIEWFAGANSRLIIYYRATVDMISVWWKNGGTERLLYSQQFDDGSAHDNINQWIHVAAQIDLTTGTVDGSALWINGVVRDIVWSGVIDAYTNDFPILSLGQELETSLGDSLFSDLLIVPYKVADSVIKDHYFKNRPWYEPKEIANVERTVKVGPGGIRMHNSALTLTDNKRRQIDISTGAGLLARDAARAVIHDIPDALILKDMVYGGHIIWKETPNFIDALTLIYTDALVNRTATKPWSNVNLTASIPPGLTNVKGALVIISLEVYAAGEKTQATTSLQGQAQYSVKYDTLPGGYNTFILIYYRSSVPEIQRYKKLSQAVIPVVYNNNIPYITWDIKMIFENMLANNFQYYLAGRIWLQGVLV